MKYLSIKFFLCLIILTVSSTFGQYTDVINSNKPGFSESPYSVGKGVYQFESSIFYRNTSIEPTFTIPQSVGVDLLFRTSFFLERLELNTQLSYQKDKVAFKNVFTSHYNISGLSKFTIGAKYLIFQQKYTDKTKEVRSWKRRMAFDKKRLIPSVALYAGVNTDFVSDLYKTQQITPKVGVLLQNDLSDQLNIITNFYYDKIGTDFSEFSYIISATQNFGDRWSAFIENQGIFQKQQRHSNIAAGLAFLYTRDLQINASGRMLFEGNSSGFYGALGVSYRIDKHHDSFKDLDENGNEIEDSPIIGFNKKQAGFFGRIFNIFKKKDAKSIIRTNSKRSRDGTSTKKEKSQLEGIERELKEFDKEIKKDEKRESKKKKKEERKRKKEEKETELEKLEREIKELEKELEKEEKQKRKEEKKKNKKKKKEDNN